MFSTVATIFTLLRPQHEKTPENRKHDPHIVTVSSSDGLVTYYGVFANKVSALRFADTECFGLNYKTQKLFIIEREHVN